MPSAVEIDDGDLLLRPWTAEDAETVGVTPASPEVGRYFGAPFDGFPDPDPDAPSFAIVADGTPVGRIWCAAQKRPFEVGYFLHPDARGLPARRRDRRVRAFLGWDDPSSALRAGRCLTP